MKRIACALAGLGLLSWAAHADETVEVKKDKNSAQIEKKHSSKHASSKTKVTSKARHRAGGGTVASTETVEQHDQDGHHAKKKTTETKEKDANGNTVREEKKVEH